MVTDLLKALMDRLTPGVIQQLSSALGLNPDKVGSLVRAAVPALLAAFAGLARSPGGREKLATAVKVQDAGLLDNLGSLLGSDQAGLSRRGSSMLGDVLGASGRDALTGAIAKQGGIAGDKAGSLLGILGPAVMGVLGQQQRAGGLDGAGLANLLAGQKDAIARAISPDLAKSLAGTGLLDAVADKLQGVSGAAATAAGSAARARSGGAAAASSMVASRARSGMPRWLYWVIAAIVVLGLGYWLLGPGGAPVVDEAAQKAQQLVVGGVDIGKQVTGAIGNATAALESVTDAASAETALPKLNDVVAEIDKVTAAAGQLPAEGKAALAAVVSGVLPAINALIDKVLAIDGVGDVLRPVLEPLKARLAALAPA
jgi:hypothetical protein